MEYTINVASKHFKDINNGLRKVETIEKDTGIKVGDILVFKECNTNKSVKVEVISVFKDEDCGLDDRYCLVGFEPLQVGNHPSLVIARSYSGLKDMCLSNINLDNVRTEFKFSKDDSDIICDLIISSINGFSVVIRLRQENI